MNAAARTVYSNYCAKHCIYIIPVLLPLAILVTSVVVSGDLKSVPLDDCRDMLNMLAHEISSTVLSNVQTCPKIH